LSGYGGGCHQKIGVSVLVRPYGQVISLKGLSDAGERLDRYELESSTAHSRPARLDQAFPLDPNDTKDWFERQPVTDLPLPAVSQANALWISRADALPRDWTPEDLDERHLWTSGLETWKKLAARGYWIAGSAESRGEDEDPALSALSEKPLKWLKLSHESAPDTDRYPNLASYRLISRSKLELKLRGKTHFYWKSASAFELALSRCPEIFTAHHACGPGNTYKILSMRLGSSNAPSVFLNYQSWLKSLEHFSP
jgi:hydroxymethylbilane synthase